MNQSQWRRESERIASYSYHSTFPMHCCRCLCEPKKKEWKKRVQTEEKTDHGNVTKIVCTSFLSNSQSKGERTENRETKQCVWGLQWRLWSVVWSSKRSAPVSSLQNQTSPSVLFAPIALFPLPAWVEKNRSWTTAAQKALPSTPSLDGGIAGHQTYPLHRVF